MTDTLQPPNGSWTFIQKILFRFFFIYFIFYISWDLLNINQALDWAVIKANEHFFQVFNIRHVAPVSNGSGDTSFAWAANYFMLVVAGIGACIWSVFDRKRKSYPQLNYMLCLIIRFSLALIAFGYGINKVFALQMPFPMLSQLATPLGDFLPMRLSWLFIGYSAPYEIFSGIMEVLGAVLLLYRRTATLGVLIATAVFINVMMLNLSYDIPVKLYSMNLVLQCLYLLANEYHRIACFFVLNKPAPGSSVYNYPLTKKWLRISRIVLKLGVVLLMGKSFYEILQYSRQYNATKIHKDFKPGMYEVTKYVVNSDTLPALITDTIRWKDLIIENNGMGSINTGDIRFRKRYGRGYFNFDVDTLQPIIHFKKMKQDTTNLFSLRYQLPDSNTIQLWGQVVHPGTVSGQRNDSIFIELKRSARHFQLAEKQFHWLSEANR